MRALAGFAAVLALLAALLYLAVWRSEPLAPREPESPAATETVPAENAEPVEVEDAAPGSGSATAERGPEDAIEARRPALAPALEISGIVLHAGGTPAGLAMVGLFQPAGIDDGEQSPFATGPGRQMGAEPERFRTVRSWTRTAADGRFRFEFPEPGRWIVRADIGELLTASAPPFELGVGESRSDLVITLPPAAWIAGRVLAPEGAALDEIALELRAGRSQPGALPLATSARLDADGGYRLGPAEAGLYTIGVALDPGLRRGDRHLPGTTAFAPVLDVFLTAGENARDIDLRGGFPGAIAVTVNVWERRTAAELLLVGRQVRVWAEPAWASTANLVVHARGPSGRQLELGPLVPGPWTLVVTIADVGPWRWRSEAPIAVAAAARVEHAIDVELALARLELLDSRTGEPLDAPWIEVGQRDGDGGLASTTRRVDGARIDLTLPPGRYLVTAREDGLDLEPDDPSTYAVLEWSIHGPAQSTLRVPR